MHGFPTGTLEPLKDGRSGAELEAARNSLVGNGFHLPSVSIFFVVLFQLISPQEGALARAASFTSYGQDERTLRDRVRSTVFEGQAVASFTGQLDTRGLIDDIIMQFEFLDIPPDIVNTVVRLLPDVYVFKLQVFYNWARRNNSASHGWGPEWTGQKRRGLVAASLGCQRFAGNARQGLDHILPPGLGKSEHLRRAKEIASPFSLADVCDNDIRFT